MRPVIGSYFKLPADPDTIYKVTSACLGDVFYRPLVRTTADQDFTGAFKSLTLQGFDALNKEWVERPGGPIPRLREQLKEKTMPAERVGVFLKVTLGRAKHPVLHLPDHRFGLTPPRKVTYNKKEGGRACFWFRITDPMYGSLTMVGLGRLNAKGTKVNMAGYRGLGIIASLPDQVEVVKVQAFDDGTTTKQLEAMMADGPMVVTGQAFTDEEMAQMKHAEMVASDNGWPDRED